MKSEGTKDMHTIIRCLAVLGALVLGQAAVAQEAAFPSKPIQLLVPFAPGGATDLTIRALAKAAEKPLGQPVVIVNKPAGGGVAAMQEVAKAAPDGYTLIHMTAITGAIAPHMRKVPYDPVKDFTPIMLYGGFNTFIAVRSDSPYKTLDDLIKDAKAHPRAVTCGISVIGASSHLGMARLAAESGMEVTFVPFGGGAPAMAALLGKHVTSVVISGEILPYVRTGEVRLLATLMAERVPEFPNVPTLRDLGYKWDMNSWLGVAGPPNLPQPIVKRLETAFLGAMEDEGFKKTMEQLAMVTRAGDAAAARQALEQDYDGFGTLMKSLKLGVYAGN